MASNHKLKPLTDTQREIMEIVWECGEVSVFEVREYLSQEREVARNTVRTMMERRETKGWLTHRVIGRTHFYSALVPKDVSLGERIVDVVDGAFGGSPETLMTALIDYRGLSAKEIERIQKLLADAKKSRVRRKKSK